MVKKENRAKTTSKAMMLRIKIAAQRGINDFRGGAGLSKT
jgi:hypothetical protein